MKSKIKRTIVILLALCFLASLTATAASAKMIFKTYGVDGSSQGGSGSANFAIPGFTYPGKVYLTPVGWDIKYTGGHHSVEEVGIFTRYAGKTPGEFYWTAGEFPVNKDGYIRGQYVAYLNDDNDDNPFKFRILFLAMQEVK